MGAVQVIAGLCWRSGPAAAAAGGRLVNIAAVGGVGAHPHVGISWVQGLEDSEPPQFADTVCAALGAIALVSGRVVLRAAHDRRPVGLVAPGALVGVVSVAAMLTGATHVHSHEDGTAAEAAGAHPRRGRATRRRRGARPRRRDATPPRHDHGSDRPVDVAAAVGPGRADRLLGVPGVTAEQQARAEALVASTLADLPQFADVTTIGAARASARSATPPPASSTTSTRPSSATTRSSTRTSRSRSSTRSTATSGRWSRRCSSPGTCRSTTPSSSTTAVR